MKNKLTAIGIGKNMNGYKVYMHKTWDLTHGYGYHIQVYDVTNCAYGFHKSNKFTAVKQAFSNLNCFDKKYKCIIHNFTIGKPISMFYSQRECFKCGKVDVYKTKL